MPVDIDNGFRHTATDLKQLQALPLDAKVAATKHRIQQWIDEYGTDGVYISFSGGKDSTVLLYIVREMMGYTQEQIPAVFSNTGLEYAEIQKFAKAHGAEFITPKMRFNEVISTYGYPLISKEVAEAIYYARRIKILLFVSQAQYIFVFSEPIVDIIYISIDIVAFFGSVIGGCAIHKLTLNCVDDLFDDFFRFFTLH